MIDIINDFAIRLGWRNRPLTPEQVTALAALIAAGGGDVAAFHAAKDVENDALRAEVSEALARRQAEAWARRAEEWETLRGAAN